MRDFILAMNLLARITYDKKLKLLFELCDDDDDGCMTPEDILQMFMRVERVFAQECARVNLDSATLDNFVADKKAEHNFHFIMGMINHQNMKRNLKIKMAAEKQKADSGNKRNNDDVSKDDAMDQQDNLITYREFISAIKNLKSLYKTILPRTLSFKEVLTSRKYEIDCHVQPNLVDDFGMFRYEINSVFKKHQFQDDKDSGLMMGRHPLSRASDGR